jgi:hypothetical protein
VSWIPGAEELHYAGSLARAFVDSIRAPAKAFVSIESGGHFVVFMKSGALSISSCRGSVR